MNIQMVDLQSQYDGIRDEINSAIADVLSSTAFIRGPDVTAFESDLASYLGVSHALGVGNGTDALQIAFMALGIGPGDEVITTAFTFIATAEAAALLGARAVFADIQPDSFNLDPDAIEARITPRTRAIVPVHLFGQPADMDPILALAERHGLAVIEDNAQAIGSEYRGRKTGALGTLGCLSFFPSKNLGAYGDGGAITTSDPDLHEKVRMISNHGSRRKYYNEVVGVNSRLDTLQAAILRVKLRYLDRYAQARQRAAERYDALLSDLPGIRIPHRAAHGTHVFHQYTIRVSDGLNGGRDALADHLRRLEIPHAIYYPVPLHKLPVFDKGDSSSHGDLVETERAAREVISLPMHTELTEEHIATVVEAVREFAGAAAA